jgi:hypothetical protein
MPKTPKPQNPKTPIILDGSKLDILNLENENKLAYFQRSLRTFGLAFYCCGIVGCYGCIIPGAIIC